MPSVDRHVPLTQNRSPHSVSAMQVRGTQSPPCGLSTQSSPDEHGIAVLQRIASHRLLIWLHVWPSPQPVIVQPGWQSVSPEQAHDRARQMFPVVAVLHSASVAQVDGCGLHTPHPIVSGARQMSGRPHSVSFLQHIGCGHPNAGHMNGRLVFRRHCAKFGRHEH